jgi:hypothetical protein
MVTFATKSSLNMKQAILFFVALAGMVAVSGQSQAQIRELPAGVTDAFTQQYPDAQQVNYEDKLVYVLVHFNQQDSASTARYTSKGVWQWTETVVDFTSLPREVQEGFNKSKYLGWQVDHSFVVDMPGKVTRYKLQVEKSTVQKRNLFFNKRGRLISDNITMY